MTGSFLIGGFFLVPMCAQRSTSKMMCVFACNRMLLFLLHDVVGDEKQKMAPISLKDPNIQGITEEFVKALTGFKVTCAHIYAKNINNHFGGKTLFFLQKSSRNFTLSVQFALSNFR